MRHHVSKCPTEGSAAQWTGTDHSRARVCGWLRHSWEKIWPAIQATLRVTSSTVQSAGGTRQVELRRLERAIESICANLDALHGRIHELEGRALPTNMGQPTLSLNLTTKSQAIKLFRGGQDARQIARTLGISVGEIELLLKVQRMQSCADARQQEQSEQLNANSKAKHESASAAQRASGRPRRQAGVGANAA